MPIWNSFKYQDLVKILEHYGCYFSGEWKGSHEGRKSTRTGKHFPVPVHWAKEIREGTLFSILKTAGITKQMVLDFLNKRK